MWSNLQNIPKKNWLWFLVLLLLVLIFYWPSFFLFFEGEEWFHFTQYLPFTHQLLGLFKVVYKGIIGSDSVSLGMHLAPIFTSVWFLDNQLFGLNYLPYIISSI